MSPEGQTDNLLINARHDQEEVTSILGFDVNQSTDPVIRVVNSGELWHEEIPRHGHEG